MAYHQRRLQLQRASALSCSASFRSAARICSCEPSLCFLVFLAFRRSRRRLQWLANLGAQRIRCQRVG